MSSLLEQNTDMRECMPGEALLGKNAYALMRAWEQLLIARLGAESPSMYAPGLISRDMLERSAYLAHFPQHALKVLSHTQERTDTERYLPPASCLHVYQLLQGTALPEPVHYTVLGRCGRHESGAYSFPYRLSTFHMLEFVTIDEHARLPHQRDTALRAVGALFEELGINTTTQQATDPFFAGEADGAYMVQKILGLKQEFVVMVAGKEVSLASVNLHERHFTDAFDIRLPHGMVTGSMCVAFGMERLVAYSMAQWGKAPEGWPATLQTYV